MRILCNNRVDFSGVGSIGDGGVELRRVTRRTVLLDNPLNVVMWIRDSLKAEEKKLNKGDLLSLGSLTKLTPTVPNTTVRARCVDLDPKGPVEITVKFI